MKALLIGQQAREHALAWCFSQAACVDTIFTTHRPSTFFHQDKIIDVDNRSPSDWITFCLQHSVDCVVVGPVAAMELGLVDACLAAGIAVLGAHQHASQLEGSKLFAKAFMRSHGIPTPDHQTIKLSDSKDGLTHMTFPCMVKSDRVIKGCFSAVRVECQSEAVRAMQTIQQQQTRLYQEAGHALIEHYHSGREFSVTVIMDDNDWKLLPIVQDYKKLHAGDYGPNTGGMGSITVDDMPQSTLESIVTTIITPTIAGIRSIKLSYRGFLYFGIVIDDNQRPILLEYNTRLGDPEAQTMMLLLGDVFFQLIKACSENCLNTVDILKVRGAAASLYFVPQGYPEYCQQGQVIPFPKAWLELSDVQVFLGAVTQDQQGNFLTADNRSLCLSVYGEDTQSACERLYAMAKPMEKTGLIYRDDIGCKK